MIAVVWHYWLGLALLIAALGLIVQTVLGYVAKVSATKYPNRQLNISISGNHYNTYSGAQFQYPLEPV